MTHSPIPLSETTPISHDFPWLRGDVPADLVDFLYVDLDGVVADFEAAAQQAGLEPKIFKYRPGAYLHLDLYPGAGYHIERLRGCFPDRLWFVSKPPSNAPYVYSEKALWMQQFFGEWGLKHTIITMDKSHVGTERSVIIDDRPGKGNLAGFRGDLVHFARCVEPKSQHWLTAFRDLNAIISARNQALST